MKNLVTIGEFLVNMMLLIAISGSQIVLDFYPGFMTWWERRAIIYVRLCCVESYEFGNVEELVRRLMEEMKNFGVLKST